jgi:hypothetical protein
MPMPAVLRRVIQAILGEEDLSTRMPTCLGKTSEFVAVETKRSGYRFEKNGQEIAIRRIDTWAFVAGLPPLYYFKGNFRNEADGAVMYGQILMSTLPKYFVFAWVGTVVLAFLTTLIWAMVLVGQFMISPSTAVKDNLTAVSFLTGGILVLGFFGASVIALVRVISRDQRRKLIVFCSTGR